MGASDSRGQQWVADNVPDLSGQVFVVTGSNSGIGVEAALIFAARGAHVVMANRSEAKTKEAIEQLAVDNPEVPQERFEFMALDLADLDSVAAFGAAVVQRHPRVDVLVCNAGVMALPLARTKQGHEMQFGTNMLGHYDLINQLLPVLQANAPKPARIVLVSSFMHVMASKVDLTNLDPSKGYSPWTRYGETKLGDLLIMTHLKGRLSSAAESHITVTACHPGYSSTNLHKGTFTQHALGIFSQSSFMGSLPTVMAATDASLKSGAYIGPNRLAVGLPAPSSLITRSAQNAEHAREVCEVMEGLAARSRL